MSITQLQNYHSLLVIDFIFQSLLLQDYEFFEGRDYILFILCLPSQEQFMTHKMSQKLVLDLFNWP